MSSIHCEATYSSQQNPGRTVKGVGFKKAAPYGGCYYTVSHFMQIAGCSSCSLQFHILKQLLHLECFINAPSKLPDLSVFPGLSHSNSIIKLCIIDLVKVLLPQSTLILKKIPYMS